MSAMARQEHQSESAEGDGLSAGDLPVIRRELLMDALEVARREHDPSAEWEAFRAVVWREAGLAFGFVDRDPWPEGLARPAARGSDQRTN